jgi:hypothetical protein
MNDSGEQAVDQAVAHRIFDHWTLREVENVYGLSRSSLQRLVRDIKPDQVRDLRAKRAAADAGLEDLEFFRQPVMKRKIMGHHTLFDQKDEAWLEQQVLSAQERHIPFTVCTLLDMARRLMAYRRGMPLRDRPQLGYGWVRGFCKRHPRLSLRTAQPLSTARHRAMTVEDAILHHDTLKTVMERHSLRDIPERIWGTDETGIKMGQKGGHGKVFAARGSDDVHQLTPTCSDHLSLIIAVNAAGATAAPAIILSSGRPPEGFNQCMAAMGFEEWGVCCEKKGFITEESFFAWLKMFVEELDAKHRVGKTDEEHLLILDQCSVHTSLRILQYADKHNVLLYGLPPHSTNYTQPADVGLFGPLKAHYWNAECELMQLRYRQYLRVLDDWTSEGAKNRQPEPREINVRDVPILLHSAIPRAFSAENIRSAFKKTGIYPLHKETILACVPRGREGTPAVAHELHDVEDPTLMQLDDRDCEEEDGDEENEDGELTLVALFGDDPKDMEFVPRVPSQRRRHPKVPKVGLQKVSYYLHQQEQEENEKKEKARMLEEKREQRKARKEEARKEAAKRKQTHQTKRNKISPRHQGAAAKRKAGSDGTGRRSAAVPAGNGGRTELRNTRSEPEQRRCRRRKEDTLERGRREIRRPQRYEEE